MTTSIKLGREVQDRITNFRGIAVSRTHYLQGCDRIAVQPKWKEGDELPPKLADFDEPDLVVVGDGVLPPDKPKKNGGPRMVVTPR